MTPLAKNQMTIDQIQLAVQVHLAEFSALREEMLEMIKWRDQLVFLSLGISGTLISFAFSDQDKASSLMSRRMALYLVAPLATTIGGFWLVIAARIYRIGVYIGDVLTPALNELISTPAPLEVFGWQSSGQRLMKKWRRRLLEWFVLLCAFVLAGLVAQYIIVSNQTGPLWSRLRTVESPVWFLLNCFLLLLSFLMFGNHLLLGRKQAGSSAIHKA
jgi:hypothetical protein